MQRLDSLNGRMAGFGEDGSAIFPYGVRTGDHGKQFEAIAPHRCVLFDDFLGDAIVATNWGNATKGSDGQTVDFAHLTGVNGLLRGTTGDDAAATMAVNGIQIHSALQWKANSSTKPRRLVMECRLALSAITGISIFVGFTDQIAALEQPCISAGSGDTITTNADDCVGFMFDTAMTTDTWWLVGSKGTVDATKQNSGIAPVAATQTVLRVEVDSDENAFFFIDGVPVGAVMASAVTKTVALTPVVAAYSNAAASRNIDLDYIFVSSDRV